MNKIIYLTHRIPYPPNKGDKIRSFNILKYLSKKYDVYLGTFIDSEEDSKYIEKLKPYVNSIKVIKIDKNRKYAALVSSFFKKKSISEVYFNHEKMHQWVNDVRNKHEIDQVFCFSSVMGQYYQSGQKFKLKVTDYVDVDSIKWLEYSQNKNFLVKKIYQNEYEKLKKFEEDLIKDSDRALFITKNEIQTFINNTNLDINAKNKISILNNGIDTEYFNPNLDYVNPYKKKINILFIGQMDYFPNEDGVLWFYETIFEKLISEFKSLNWYIIGSNPLSKIKKLNEHPNITVLGYVDDIRPYMKFSNLSIAPLRIARGVQNKVLEAMAMSLPIVASKVASEGINVQKSNSYKIPEGIDDWLIAIREILSDPEMLHDSNRQKMVTEYQWKSTLSILDNIL